MKPAEELKRRAPYETKDMFLQRQISHLVKERDQYKKRAEHYKHRYEEILAGHKKEIREFKERVEAERDTLKEALRLACERIAANCNEYITCKKGCYCDASHFIDQAKKSGTSAVNNTKGDTMKNCKVCGAPIHTNNELCEACREGDR